MNWYYLGPNGQPAGPIEDKEFDAAVQEGLIAPETHVWNQSLTEWTLLKNIRPTPFVPVPIPELVLPAPNANPAVSKPNSNVPDEPENLETLLSKHLCSVCKKNLATSVMTRFGEGWICNGCRISAIKKSKYSGSASGGNSKSLTLSRKLGFVVLCLGLAAAIFFWKRLTFTHLSTDQIESQIEKPVALVVSHAP